MKSRNETNKGNVNVALVVTPAPVAAPAATTGGGAVPPHVGTGQ